jgi:hypothetical protein
MGYLTFIIVIALFIDLFFTSITSPILYSTFAPVRRRRRSLGDSVDLLKILGLIEDFEKPSNESSSA